MLSLTARLRFTRAGIDDEHLRQILPRVRALTGWPVAWVRAARSYIALARQAQRAGESHEAARLKAKAALCFHFAQVLEYGNLRRKRQLGRRAATVFARAVAHPDFGLRHVEIPWRGTTLPGYLRLPVCDASGPYSLVVLLNGASTVKEETIHWADAFVAQGQAVLAIDTPGSGESLERAPGSPDQIDVADALLVFAESEPLLKRDDVYLVGVSLRGAMAVQLAAARPEIAGVVAVTAPFSPASYVPHLNSMVRQEVALSAGVSVAELPRMADEMSIESIAPRLRSPILVVGAGKDLVVPPEESLRLYRSAGGPKQLLYLERANHVGFSHMDVWTRAAASWIARATSASA